MIETVMTSFYTKHPDSLPELSKMKTHNRKSAIISLIIGVVVLMICWLPTLLLFSSNSKAIIISFCCSYIAFFFLANGLTVTGSFDEAHEPLTVDKHKKELQRIEYIASKDKNSKYWIEVWKNSEVGLIKLDLDVIENCFEENQENSADTNQNILPSKPIKFFVNRNDVNQELNRILKTSS